MVALVFSELKRMNDLKPRKTQTRVKHEILDSYLRKWGYIISKGIRNTFKKLESQGRPFQIRFAYIDCFSSTGLYAPEDQSDKPVYGSPVIGIQALEHIRDYARDKIGFTPDIVSILFERERKRYDALLKTLDMAGYGPIVRQTKNFFGLNSGEIATVNGDSNDYVESLLAFTGQDYTWAFYLLDPQGPSGIPLDVVAPIIARDRTDVMINVIYYDLPRTPCVP